MIKEELDRIKDRISDPNFLANKGLSNEVGIHVFCYDPKDEIVVQDYIRRLSNVTFMRYSFPCWRTSASCIPFPVWRTSAERTTFLANYRKSPPQKRCLQEWTTPLM